MTEEKIVNGEVITPEVVTPQTQEEVTPEEVTPPGSKTDSALLLESLQAERIKRKVAEDKNELLEEQLKNPSTPEPEIFSDEGKVLQNEIKIVQSNVQKLTEDNAKKDVIIANPILKDKMEAFDDFRNNPENKGMNIKTAAKAFIIENGLSDKPRKGLEKTTGGDRTPQTTGMTSAEVANLRKNNHRKYKDMLSKGLIKIKD